MKKTKFIIFFLLCASVFMITSGCVASEKTPVSTESFLSEMKKIGFEAHDIKEKYADADHVLEVYVCVNQKVGFQIEFYRFNSEDTAKRIFAGNKKETEDNAGSKSSYSSVVIGNYGKFRQTSNGEYIVISQIADTLIYIKAPEGNKVVVNNILDGIGY